MASPLSSVPAAGLPEISGYRDLALVFRSVRTTIYSATRIAGNERVVLKTVTPGAPDERARWRLQHEFMLLGELTETPGVIRTGGLVSTPFGTALELQHLGSGDLHQLAGQVVPFQRVLDIGVKLAETVAALHLHHVSHRDINPSNVLYHGASSDLWLIDFGLATKLERATTEVRPTGRLEGTLGYLSPEQTGRMNRSVDRRTDLYSLGATLYQVLVGRPPFVADDDLEMLHATVALRPQDPRRLRPDVPEALAEILLKLLEKDAEDRYQDARALADDLRHCRDELAAQGDIAPFPIGRTDRRGTFLVPERLVGREAEVAVLADALDQTISGHAGLVGIAGPTGVGKSALVRELLPRLTDGGLLANGVCDSVDRTPYAPILQVLRTIYDAVLAGDPAMVDWHRGRYEAAVDGQGGLLKRLLPELEAILGPQGDVPDLPPAEAQKRVIRLLVRLLRAYHDPTHALVLFFDDLQWADGPTLDVLHALLSSPEPDGPLVLLAWRDDEVPPDHPFQRLLEAHAERMQRVRPGPLTGDDVAELLSHTLSVPADILAPLAERVHRKTAGNAFFVRRFLTDLHDREMLEFDVGQGIWTWRLDRIDAMGPTPNVAALIETQLERMGPAARKVLGAAACVGKQVPASTLQHVARLDAAELRSGLTEAVEAGLFLPLGDTWNELQASFTLAGDDSARLVPRGSFRFAHDAVHEASLELPDPEEQLKHHLRAGRMLLERWTREMVSPFEAADQLNRATELLADPDERREVAALNLAAGERAAASAAFATALHYLEAGANLLSEEDWSRDYDLAFPLHLRAAESLLMCPDHAARADYVAVAMERARDTLDQVAVQRVRIRHATGRYEFEDTIRLTLEALGWVGVHIPANPGQLYVGWTLLRTRWRVRGLDADGVLALPEATDPEVVAALELMMDASAPAYYVGELLLPVFLCRMLELTALHGLSPGSAFACGGYAFLQIATADDVDTATMWADAARRIVEKYDAKHVSARTTLLTVGFVDCRTRPLASLIQPFLEAAWQAREVGDAEYTALCHFNRTFFTLLAGVELREASRRADVDLVACREMAQAQSVNAVRSLRQQIDCLRGQAEDPAHLSGPFMDYDEMLAEMKRGGDQSGPTGLYIRQTLLLLLFGEDTDRLISEVDKVERELHLVPGSPDVGPFRFYACLALCRKMREQGVHGGSLMRRVDKHLAVLRRWANHCASNHAHKVRLVEAEIDDLRGQVPQAIRGYDQAIHLARASGMLHEEAICTHWAALAAIRHGHARNAAALLREARAAWLAWGCTPMLPMMTALEADLLGGSTGLLTDISRTTTARSTSRLDARSFDATAVLKAARALSSQIDLDPLLESLMQTTVQSAGATGGMLVLLDSEGRQGVAATAAATEDGIEVELFDRAQPTATAASRADVAPVVQYVIRRRRPVAIHDGAGDPRFFQGLAEPPRSALCVPAIKGQSLVAVMYVENTLARNAFTEDRHELVELLCAQAAISIENARLYEELHGALDTQKRLTHAYGRFMPPQFLGMLGKQDILELGLGDQAEREVTVMFADIREFTGMAEAMGPEATFAFINRYLGRMEPAIHAHRGFVNQYLGDGIMAIFPGTADDALSAALAMLDGLRALNHELVAEGQAEVRIGIGLNTGPLMIGAIGGMDRMGRGCVGDTTNVAARIEGMTKTYGVPLLIGESTQAALADANTITVRPVERVHPKGRAEPITVYEVVEGTRLMPPEAPE